MDADLRVDRFFEVKADKLPAEGKGYTDNLRTPREMEALGITRWGIMGGQYLVLIDTDKKEMYEILKKTLLAGRQTFEVTSPRRGCPHLYIVVAGGKTDVPNAVLHIPNDVNADGKKMGAGEIRVGHQYLVAPGTVVSYLDKKGHRVEGIYEITNNVPLARFEFDDFMNAVKPYISREAIEDALLQLVKYRLILLNTRSVTDLNGASHYRITDCGTYFLHVLITRFSYIDLVLANTPISDPDVALNIRYRLPNSELGVRFERTQLFTNYLRAMEEREFQTFPEYPFSSLGKYKFAKKIDSGFVHEKTYILKSQRRKGHQLPEY